MGLVFLRKFDDMARLERKDLSFSVLGLGEFYFFFFLFWTLETEDIENYI